ncbi:uncharacterized protein SPPG_07928 [Spizellomyces punctatus DAOM BR117]|uniref:histidine kinase n=1 Tax=Spizellomyces punctatus (strain DAOM BR117) TaxID=645134 RepID=A0A0L0H6X8_SPIPD|nr:uncharacterized protein SPPG_07928 [Spizellomyces punctatus DAOM BR117]KNC96719.1 hypothetical protein SPPG_07928 [Spizellomyces punctatus DAOM BR117]|eukprot:XP_016604759.1 hypothetical protein SPPG_07928 [Spizellomyces punctatus DAOM BR117]
MDVVLLLLGFLLERAWALPVPVESSGQIGAQTLPDVSTKLTVPWADAVIGASYFAIPVELAFFVFKLPSTTLYQKCVGGLFVAFILFCGIGHFLDASHMGVEWVIADRYLTAGVSAITAIASPYVLNYSVEAIKGFSEESKLVEKQRDMLADAQALTHLGNWELREDEKTGVRWINASDEFFRIFGMEPDTYEANRITYDRYWKCVAPEDREKIDKAVSEALLNGDSYHIIQRIRRESDRKEVYIRGYGKPVIRDGKIQGLRGTAQDITSQVFAEMELTRAKEEALIESKHKDVFLATMSHELRTPLTSIIGHVELMDETPMDETQKEYMSNARRAATTLLSLINDILDYSKLTAGKVDLDLRVTSVAEILDDVRAISKDLGKEVTLRVDSYDGPNVIGDSTRLKQILLNLVSNAVKFTMPGGYVFVTNTWTVDNADRVNLTISVRDTGIGMSEQVIQRLFNPFTQADASTSRRFGGTGLGLSIVKKLVNAMDGSIEVTSEENKGSTFTVLFKLPKAHVLPQEVPVPDKMGSMRILVAEDNKVTQSLLKRMLRDFTVDVADNGRQAVDMVKKNESYHMLFCDLNMPVLDGLEATREIRKTTQGREIFIVGLTANAFKTDRENCLKAGMNDYLSKPFTKLSLLAMIAKAKLSG